MILLFFNWGPFFNRYSESLLHSVGTDARAEKPLCPGSRPAYYAENFTTS